MTTALALMITVSISAIIRLSSDLHYLQQCSYFTNRYAAFLFKKPRRIIIPLCYFGLIFSLYALNMLYALVAALLCLSSTIILAFNHYRHSIKPLVITARIVRSFLAAAIVLSAAVLCFYHFKGEVPGIFIIFISCFSPLLAILANTLILPVQFMICKGYKKDAVKKLSDNPGLLVIGIAGSYGKTSVKQTLFELLSPHYNVVMTPGNYNTTMGVVRTIRELLTPATEIFICEMGAKRPGDIKEICDIVHPKLGIITSIGPQHLESFKTLNNIVKTKFELEDAVTAAGGRMYLAGYYDNIAKRFDAESTNCIIKTHGSERHSVPFTTGKFSRDGMEFSLELCHEVIELKTSLIGSYCAGNISLCAAAAFDLGVSSEDIRRTVLALKPAEHRLQLKTYINGSLLIDDAYNSNPEGADSALKAISSFAGMKKIIITCGMVELGSRQAQHNFDFGKKAAACCDILVVVGKTNRAEISYGAGKSEADCSVILTGSFAEALETVTPMLNKDHVLLIENDLPDNYM